MFEIIYQIWQNTSILKSLYQAAYTEVQQTGNQEEQIWD